MVYWVLKNTMFNQLPGPRRFKPEKEEIKLQEQQNQPEDQKGIRWMSQTFKGLCASTGVSAVLIIAVSVMIRLLRTKLDMPLILLLLVALLAVFVYGLASTLQNYN